MKFTLAQRTQTGTTRQFTFLGDREKGSGLQVTVEVDMELVRKYGIGLQDLPLICTRFLETLEQPLTAQGPIAFTEDKMKAIKAEADRLRLPKETRSWKIAASNAAAAKQSA